MSSRRYSFRGTIKCPECQRVFNSREELNLHYDSEPLCSSKLLRCNMGECREYFKNQWERTQHMKNRPDHCLHEKSVSARGICKICKTCLHYVVNDHDLCDECQTILPYKCKEFTCGRGFLNEEDLIGHLNRFPEHCLHPLIADGKCTYCESTDLYTCFVCVEETYMSREAMIEHLRLFPYHCLHDLSPPTRFCEICGDDTSLNPPNLFDI